MLAANKDNFMSSFPIWRSFILFTCLIALARTSSKILKRRGKRRHPCLVPDLSGKASSFSLLRMMLTVGFFVFYFSVVFIKLWKFSSIPVS